MSEHLPYQRVVFSIGKSGLKLLKHKMLNWATRFGIFLFLDSNGHTAQGGKYDCLVGAGARKIFHPVAHSFDELYQFHKDHKQWLFGHLCYDLKNELEPTLSSDHEVRHGFPLMQFFIPEVIAGIDYDTSDLFIEAEDPAAIYRQIMAEPDTIENEI